MATYVVDASVLIQYLVTQVYTPETRVLIARMYQGDQLHIPEFCLLECVMEDKSGNLTNTQHS